MDGLVAVLAYATLPALGNLIGNLLAELVKTPRWVVGVALHGAAGIAIALVSFELMPRVIDHVSSLTLIAAFLAGAGLSVALAYGVRYFGSSSDPRRHAAWMVYAAIGADLFSDGLMTGAGMAVDRNLGILIAAAQLAANIPGGFASAANLRQRKVRLRTRVVTSALLFGAVLLSAAVGFLLLSDRSDVVQNTVIAGMIGLLLLSTVEDMVPEADAPQPSRWLSSLGFAAGFIGLILVSGVLASRWG